MPARLYGATDAQAILDDIAAADKGVCTHDATSYTFGCLCRACYEKHRAHHNAGVAAPDLAASVIVHANASDALRAAILEHLAAIDEVTHGAAPHVRVVAAEAALRALVATPATTPEH